MSSDSHLADSAEGRARRAGCPVADFDPEVDPAFRHDLRAQWNRARELGPVFYSTGALGFWVLSAREEIAAALTDAESFSPRLLMAFSRRASTDQHLIPMTLDPPEHTAYRRLLTPLFGPREVGARESQMRTVANEIIDDVVAAGSRIDFMAEFAYRLPGRVFGSWLGLPDAGAEQFTRLAKSQVHYDPTTDPSGARFADIQREIHAVVDELIASKRAAPGADIASELLAADFEGRPLRDDELSNIITLLFLAGFDTTAGAIGEVVAHLACHPEHRRAVRSDPGALERLVEECLRFYSISGASGRIVLRDVEIGGCRMRPGDRVFSVLQAAGRDPKVFDRPDEIDIDRWPNRHVSFGLGVHRCLGSHVARAEITTSVGEWVRRIPDFEIAEGVELRHMISSSTAFEELPLVLHLSS